MSCQFLHECYFKLEFQVLTAVRIKLAIFWFAAPCSLAEVYLRFKGSYCLHQGPVDGGSEHL
jgi:hypothetical protein